MYPLKRPFGRLGMLAVCCMAAGLAVGIIGTRGLAQDPPPSEHKGLEVKKLGVVSAESMKATVGLEGHILLLREITIEPGGQIAKHSHEEIPGLVKVIDGAWVEGQEGGEATFDAGGEAAIVEDETTVHWFYNRGSEPATAIVCDIRPAG